MSYAPFTPDVRPIPADQYVAPPRRVGRWAIGVALYFALIAVWLWWMLLPPKLQPSLATIPLPDGTELRLVHVDHRVTLTLSSDQTFDGRIRPSWERHPSQANLNGAWHDSTWLVFTRYDPRTDSLSTPALDDFWIAEESPPFLHRVFIYSGYAAAEACQVLLTDIAPARASTWKVQFHYDGQLIHATLANPFPIAPAQEFSPKPLPQTVTVGPATIEFTGVEAGRRDAWNVRGLPAVIPRTKITVGEIPTEALQVNYTLFDATGQRTSDGVLPFGEPAWGLQVNVFQLKAPTSACGQSLLAEVASPGPGVVEVLPVPPEFAACGVTDVLFAGAGQYSLGDRKLFDRIGNGRVGNPPEELHERGKVTSDAQTDFGVREPTLLILFQHHDQTWPKRSRQISQQIEPVKALRFQLRGPEGFLETASGLGTATLPRPGPDGIICTLMFRRFPLAKTARPFPATKLRLEYFAPKVVEAKFYFPPPHPAKFR